MSWITSLAREAVQKGRAYKAPTTSNLARLHANELPWPPDYDPDPGSLNWYPLLYPAALTERMAEHYGVRPEEVSVTRGSSEGIDCLYRAFCESGRDSAIFCPPSFEMFRWYGRLQGARVLEVPLRAADGFSLDVPAIKGGLVRRRQAPDPVLPQQPHGQPDGPGRSPGTGGIRPRKDRRGA